MPVSDLVTAVETVNLNLPDSQPGQEIIIDSDFLIDDNGVVENPDKDTVIPVEPERELSPDPEPSSDPELSPDPEPSSDPELSPDPEPSPDPELSPDSEPSLELEPSSDPEPSPDPDSGGDDDTPNSSDPICLPTSDPDKTTCDIDLDPPDSSEDSGNDNDGGIIIAPSLELVCDSQDCEQEDNFSVVPFYVYVAEQMQNNPKFPFDIFGDFSQLEVEDKCPQLSLFGYSKDLCFVNDGLRTFKYPIWIAWLIKLALSL